MRSSDQLNAPDVGRRLYGNPRLFGVTHVLWCVVTAFFVWRCWGPLVPMFFAWPIALIVCVGLLCVVAYLVRVRDSADRPLRPTEWIPHWAAALSVFAYVQFSLHLLTVDNHRFPRQLTNEFIASCFVIAAVSFPVARQASWRFLLIGLVTLVFPHLLSGVRAYYEYPG